MNLIEELKNLSDTIKEFSNHDLNEPDTETFCFEPFIGLLGFKRTPADMQKQYPADISGGNRTADYAIKKDGVPIMIVECKRLEDNLDDDFEQLKGYFSAVSGARFGVLTNGRLYRFYTDLDESNLMDSDPFLEIDLFEIKPVLVAELERFTKSRFDVDKALAAAHNLKYSKMIQQFLMGQLESPNEDFVNYVASVIDIPINTPEQRAQIAEIVQRALKTFKSEDICDSLPPDDDVLARKPPTTKDLYFEYWTELCAHLKQRNGVIKPVAPNKGHWLYFYPFRSSNFFLCTVASVQKQFIHVSLKIWGENAKPHFHLFKRDRRVIEKEISAEAKLEWNEKPDKKESDIQFILPNTDPRENRDRQHQWLCDKLELFYRVFKPRIDALKKEKTSDA